MDRTNIRFSHETLNFAWVIVDREMKYDQNGMGDQLG
jgi:hypothetical protein